MKKMNLINIELVSKKIEAIRPALKEASVHPGWIAFIRKALGMTYEQLAKKVNLHTSTVSDAEKREADGKVTVETLKKYAEAMGCDFVYAFVPKVKLEDFIKEKAREKVIERFKEANIHMALEGQETEITESTIEREVNEIFGTKAVWE